MQIIFQDPYSALNPRQTIGKIISAPFEIQGITPPEGVKTAVQNSHGARWFKPRALQPLPT
jgi:ABC-type microcin C transport system duplicated ATPase subunit YejF